MKTKNTATNQLMVKEIESTVRELDNYRAGTHVGRGPCEDISMSEFVKEKYNLSFQDYLDKIGIEPGRDTMDNLLTVPDESVKWLVPEIIREAITLGIRTAPIYPSLIASEQSVSSLTVVMPQVNMSDAAPAKINEGETIPLGTVSFGQKNVTLFKIGKGLKITDELRMYVSMDIMAIYLRDFGVKLGYAQDVMAIDVLINGDKNDGSESAPVIGVGTVNQLEYRDLLRVWIRAARMGRNFSTMIADEEMALDILSLPQFSTWTVTPNYQNVDPIHRLNLRTPIPNSSDVLIHGNVPEDGVLLVDRNSAMIKLNARALMLETERIVSNQTEGIYATLSTGFAKMYRDASILIDRSQTFATAGFPDYMEVDSLKNIGLE